MNNRPPRYGVKEEKNNTLIIDGNSLFKTGFHGAKDAYNHKGQHIGGLYQFLTMLRKFLSEDLYHKVFVFWDGNLSGKLRYDLYPPYKSGRGKDFINGTQPTDEAELLQRLMIQEYIEELFIRQLKHEVIEGDDFIAFYCLQKKLNEKITIVSNDRDMCQLISDNIRLYVLDFKVYIDNVNYSEYFYHHQTNSSLIKTIVGDNSDTIKGVKGVKEQTLLKLFPELKERPVTLNEIINQAKLLQNERLDNKKKPLAALNNIIHGITYGAQGNKLYEINDLLVNLKKPLMTEDGISQLEHLIEGSIDPTDRGLKNVLEKMKRDGLDRMIGEFRYPDFLIPFKRLIEREITQTENKKENYE